jgi:hypothetical protein
MDHKAAIRRHVMEGNSWRGSNASECHIRRGASVFLAPPTTGLVVVFEEAALEAAADLEAATGSSERRSNMLTLIFGRCGSVCKAAEED